MSQTSSRPLYIVHSGPTLLETPLLNKDSAFTLEERVAFNLVGLLPQNIETIEEQAERVYQQYRLQTTDLDRHIYLRSIQDSNETLFFRVLEEHLEEMLPIIYTPTVGEACQSFSQIYRSHRGLFISYPHRDHINDILHSATKDNVKVVVITDGERILGLGDQGIGGMGIPIGKLSLYTACGGISPAYTLPVVIDVGTNNPDLLDDPMYMGWRHERITGDEYYDFVDQCIQGIRRRWPNAIIQFEDFAQANAMPLLKRYRDEVCCFNDDIQGTAAVALGTLLAACKAKNEKLSEQTISFVGAGSAGCGIAEQIVEAMQEEGLSETEARRRIYMIDRYGLLTDDMTNLVDFQRQLVQRREDLSDWDTDEEGDLALIDVVRNAKPTILIGVSGQRGLFSEEVIKTMHQHCSAPLVMPLSNPTSRVEATPKDILEWTNGEALVSTGSPFQPVTVNERRIPIAQCNNAYIFPGVGLGAIAVNASRITDGMLTAAARALSDCSPVAIDGYGAVLPPLSDIQSVSRTIAFAVAKRAQEDGVALQSSDEDINQAIEANFWLPRYRHYRRASY
ncbi:NAD-dependent malic enzyme [Kushneria phosphatilytica]|uniref:NAD-dependent malic enzyme n=1 Tax=Kushneria phosphatilytica TaxID=657387 RepID=A0A1S1NVB6_9GAMM|nr:NAD-dependent malic enzyme [Kushneria phosphatilytica]OHV07707.1 NAD-dependent malic enzyme [Kushneria phosphatilytica]QEL10204.1 NAD-dependent malic enzyme [Kushneria phosphatilytica]